MSGFQINRSTLEAQKIWHINFSAANSKEAHDNHHIIEEVITQYTAPSGDQHVLPTIFGEDGVLLYKFFDSNFFAVIASKESNPSEISFFVVNAVSGHIVHQYSEKNVQRSNKSKVTCVLSENVLAVTLQKINIATGLSQ